MRTPNVADLIEPASTLPHHREMWDGIKYQSTKEFNPTFVEEVILNFFTIFRSQAIISPNLKRLPCNKGGKKGRQNRAQYRAQSIRSNDYMFGRSFSSSLQTT